MCVIQQNQTVSHVSRVDGHKPRQPQDHWGVHVFGISGDPAFLGQSQMLCQGSSRIAPQTVFQLTWCFRKTFLLPHKFTTAWAIEMTADREEWSELPIGATTATSVIRRSSVPPCAWAGPTTNWLQPETVAKSMAATPWRLVVVEPNHSWWWEFKSPTNRKEARTSSACTAAIDASKQSKIRSSRSGLR